MAIGLSHASPLETLGDSVPSVPLPWPTSLTHNHEPGGSLLQHSTSLLNATRAGLEHGASLLQAGEAGTPFPVPLRNCVLSLLSDDPGSGHHLNELLRTKFNDATVIISVVVLVLINLVVIAGNILVILSVFVSSKLRTVTNFFIVSLAVADFLVGIAVLPYSLTLEILDTWIFGEMWCQGWLVIDVWMCTASILNLVAISVDRYLAVTRPVRYRSLMTAKRAKIIIAAVWVVSFIICFPPLLVRNKEESLWPESTPPELTYPSHLPDYLLPSLVSPPTPAPPSEPDPEALPALTPPPLSDVSSSLGELSSDSGLVVSAQNDTSQSRVASPSLGAQSPVPIPNSAHHPTPISCTPQPVQCVLFRDKSYVIYSACGSFFIPMFVMIFFYWRIYLVAIRTSRALKRGYRTTKSSGVDGINEERLTLRIHRGYATDENLGEKCTVLDLDPATRKALRSGSGATRAEPSSPTHPGPPHPPVLVEPRRARSTRRVPITIYRASRPSPLPPVPSGALLTVDHLSLAPPPQMPSSGSSSAGQSKCNTLTPAGSIGVELNGKNRRNSPGCQSTLSLPSSNSPTSSREGSAKSNKVVLARLSKRTSKYQAKRFHAETKAAKTVGIIVGGFIVCWLPFFTVYLARAFCEDCIPELLFSIFFWLGYCNSMINPCIYGLFSRDFRRAFRNIICRCKCREETSVSSLIRQIHMPTFFEDMPEELAKPESQEY